MTKIKGYEVEHMPVKTILGVIALVLIVWFIYEIVTGRNIMYDLCRSFFNVISIIPGINPGSVVCSWLR